MKNNKLQELKPIYIHENTYQSANEVSLIDLAMVLIKRKALIITIIIGFLIFSISVALLTSKKYTYSTSLEIGSQIINDNIRPFESPQTLSAKLQNGFIPKALSKQHKTSQKDSPKFKIEVSIPKDSKIVVLKAVGTDEKGNIINKLLQDTANFAIEDHNRVYEAVRKNLTSQIEQTEIELSSLNTAEDSYEDKARLLKSDISLLQSQLANLRGTRQILPPMKSTEPTGTNKKLLVIASMLIGLFVSILAAFFVEFIFKIQERSRESTDPE